MTRGEIDRGPHHPCRRELFRQAPARQEQSSVQDSRSEPTAHVTATDVLRADPTTPAAKAVASLNPPLLSSVSPRYGSSTEAPTSCEQSVDRAHPTVDDIIPAVSRGCGSV